MGLALEDDRCPQMNANHQDNRRLGPGPNLIDRNIFGVFSGCWTWQAIDADNGSRSSTHLRFIGVSLGLEN
jgi:hypothetical protein